MRRERGPHINILKGHLFEAVVLRLLKENGFSQISAPGYNIREDRQAFVEILGRGTWHQIDCPCTYDNMIPFLYPIRLLGEVKYYSEPITKSEIRSFIGALKDIQENYFSYLGEWRLHSRYTDLGVFISASGFNEEAEKLAYAHGVSLVSYNNHPIMRPIISILSELERDFFKASICVAPRNVNDFITMFRDFLDGYKGNIHEFQRKFEVPEGFEKRIDELRENLFALRANFIGTTTEGILLHFVGQLPFPVQLFYNTDFQNCQVHVEDNTVMGRGFYLVINEDKNQSRFYFTPPRALEYAANMTARDLLDMKREMLLKIQVPMHIGGLFRNLTLTLDVEWIERLKKMS